MGLPKFFIDPGNLSGGSAVIQGDDYLHLKNVLRCRVGNRLTLCDGQGTDYTGVIDGVEPGQIRVGITSSTPCLAEPNLRCVLYQALPKGEKMDLIVQKAVELGVHAIVPVRTGRCVVKLTDKDGQKKAARWQKIALEAAKQSGRGVIPTVSAPVDFAEALRQLASFSVKAVLYEKEREGTLHELFSPALSDFAFLVGPEGGLEETEVRRCRKQGILPVGLGQRILRTETAALCVLSIAMYATQNL